MHQTACTPNVHVTPHFFITTAFSPQSKSELKAAVEQCVPTPSSMSHEQRFDEAVRYINTDSSEFKTPLNNDQKLHLYGLFKQATEGDVKGSQPWAAQMTARSKWDAWNALKGKTKDVAMGEYADLVGKLKVSQNK